MRRGRGPATDAKITTKDLAKPRKVLMKCIFSLNHQALMNSIVWFGFANLGLLLGPVITTAMETPVVR